MVLSQKGSPLLVTVILCKILETKMSEKNVLGCKTICKKEEEKNSTPAQKFAKREASEQKNLQDQWFIKTIG